MNQLQPVGYECIKWQYQASLYQGMGFRLAGSGTINLHDMIQENQIYFEYEVK